jgi:hypothetical protein
MDLLTPEELEQAILAPIQSPLCSELMSKLLLKKVVQDENFLQGKVTHS